MKLLNLLKHDLAKETQVWVGQGIISENQAQQICTLYGVDYSQQNQRSWGYNVLIALGYLFIGLAVIVLISANWDNIPRALRMISLIVLTIITQSVGLYYYYHNKFIPSSTNSLKQTGINLFLLGNLFFGASIILIAQIYHLGEHMPDGIFWWALGTLPFGIITKNSWLSLQTLILAIIWAYIEISLNYYPTLFILFIFASLYVLWHNKTQLLLFLTTIFSIGLWFILTTAYFWGYGFELTYTLEHWVLLIVLLILFYAISLWLNTFNSTTAKDYASLLSLWCLRGCIILLFILSFSEVWRELMDHNWPYLKSITTIIIIILLSAIFLAYKANHLRSLFFFTILFIGAFFTVIFVNNTEYALLFSIIDNIVIVTVGGYLIIQGIQRGISHYFFLGITTILLIALVRYADLIGDYIGTALLFIVFALVLLGAAHYWRKFQKYNKKIAME